MTTNLLKTSAALTVTLALFVAPAVFAKDSTQITGIKKTLAAATPIELPAKAAGLVSAAADKEQSSVTVAVVKVAVELNPSATPAIVGAIAHDVPTMAPLAAVTAASAQRKQLAQIAQSAAAAAPAQAGQIVAALIREFPSHYTIIAIAVSKGAPASGKEILTVVGDSVPVLKAPIQATVATFGANTSALPVDAILSQSSLQASATTPTAPAPERVVQPPPIIGAPFMPLPPSPPEINNTQNNPEQPGGRSYSSP